MKMRGRKEELICPAVCKFIHLDANNTISMALMKTIFINEWNQQKARDIQRAASNLSACKSSLIFKWQTLLSRVSRSKFIRIRNCT